MRKRVGERINKSRLRRRPSFCSASPANFVTTIAQHGYNKYLSSSWILYPLPPLDEAFVSSLPAATIAFYSGHTRTLPPHSGNFLPLLNFLLLARIRNIYSYYILVQLRTHQTVWSKEREIPGTTRSSLPTLHRRWKTMIPGIEGDEGRVALYY